MDRLAREFDKMDLSRHQRSAANEANRSSSSSSEWTTVSSPRNRHSASDFSSAKNEPLLTSPTCPFSIYQIPRFMTEQSVVKLVNGVVNTGTETMRLFQEVTKGIYPKEIVILRGVPGCGKSSIAAALVATTRKGQVCSADDYFTNGRGVYIFNAGRLTEAHKDAQGRCRKLMEKEISPIIIDNTNTRRFEMESYVSMAIEFNYYVRLFEPETAWRNNPKVLAAKNVHEVPKGKIQDMINRYEQVMPYMLVNDVAKKMGAIGKKYNPLKNETVEGSSKLLDTSASSVFTTDSVVAKSLAESHVLLKESKEFLPMSRLTGPLSPPPKPSLFEFVKDSMESPASSKGRMKRKSKSAREPPTVQTPNESATPPPAPVVLEPQYDTKLKKSLQTLKAFFPTCGVEELKDLLEKCNGDVDDATIYLMDSQYVMAEEIIEEPLDIKPAGDQVTNNVVSNSPATTDPQAEHVSKPASDSPVENAPINNKMDSERVPLQPMIENQTSANQICNEDNESNDGPDWFNLALPQHTVRKIIQKYGDSKDPRIQKILQKLTTEEEVSCRVPPEMAFDFYAKVMNKAASRTYLEAENVVRD